MRGTVVTDTYARTVSGGWGSANTGQAWTSIGAGGTISASDWNVSGGVATQSVPTTVSYRFSYLATFSQPFVDVAVTGSVTAVATGAPLELAGLMTRGTDTSNYYFFKTQVEPGGAVTAWIYAPGGAVLGSVTVPGITYTANLQLRVRAQSVGRIHRMKVWAAAGSEPPAYVLSVTDGTYTGAGFIGIRSGIASGNTNTLPVVFSYRNFASVLLADFPNDPLPVQVLAAFGANLSADPSTWPWTDITSDVRVSSLGIGPMGRVDETSQASPATCAFQLLNPASAYSVGNPLGPNYPNVRRNTPIWVLVGSATRFFGYANGWTPSWDVSGTFAIVSVSASGILRRLTQGKTPLRSPLYRFLAGTSPVAYWPLEDGADSSLAASGVTNGAPLVVRAGVMTFNNAGPIGSAGAAQPQPSADNSLSATVSGVSATTWQMSIWTRGVDTTAGQFPTYYVPAEVRTTTGQVLRFSIERAVSATLLGLGQASSEGATGAEHSATGTINNVAGNWVGFDGNWHLMQATFTQSGGDTICSFAWDNLIYQTATWTGVTIGAPKSVSAIGRYAGQNGAISANMKETSIAHLAFHNGATFISQWSAGLGWRGELATDRITRLCNEQGVPLALTGTGPTTMGPQSIDTFVNLLRECETADHGLLYDGYGAGLGYISRQSRYNQATVLTLDMAAAVPQVDDPFQPVDDDQRNRNLYKVDRKNGSSATFEDKTGPLGTDSIEVYDSSLTVNTDTDAVLMSHAGWMVHLGTVEGLRYPSLSLNLAAVPGAIDDWVGGRLATRVDVLNVASKATGHAPGTVALLKEGYSESFGAYSWTVAANCSPSRPWDVATAGGTAQRVAAVGSTLAANLTAGGTSLSLASTASNGLWTTNPAMYPLDVRVGGEQARLDMFGQVLNLNAFLPVDSSEWVATNATKIRDTSQVVNSTWGSMLITPDGVNAAGGVSAVTRVAVTAGASYLAMCWVYSPGGWSDLRPAVDWYTATSGGTFLSTSLGSAFVVPAGVWTLLQVQYVAPVTAAGAVMRARHGGTPAAGATWYVTAICLIPVTSYNASPQTMTFGARGLNGANRAWTSGTEVQVWSPAVVAL